MIEKTNMLVFLRFWECLHDVMNPLEVANILISSQNHYDFRNQRQKIPKKDVDQSPQQKSLHTPPLTYIAKIHQIWRHNDVTIRFATFFRFFSCSKIMLLVLKGRRTVIVNSYSKFSIHAPVDFPKGGPGGLVTKLVFNQPSIYTRLALGDRGWGLASLACRHAPQKKLKLQLCRKNAEFSQKRDMNSQKLQKMARNDLSVEKQIQKPVQKTVSLGMGSHYFNSAIILHQLVPICL